MSRIKTKFLSDNAVTNAKLAQIATQTFKGRTTAGTGNVEDLTTAQATALLDIFTSGLKGLAPASGGGTTNFLRADGTWASPAAGSSPLTTKGDLFTYDTADQRLGIGTNGQVLTADSAEATGIKWATPASSSLLPTIFGTRAAPRSVVAATGITTGASHMSSSADIQDIYIEGSITGDSIAATISAGTNDGQRMTLIGRTDTKTVTLNSTTTNVALNGPITMGAGDVLNLRYDGTNWHEMSRS